MQRTMRRALTATATASAVAFALLPAGTAAAHGQSGAAQVRRATAQFHNVQAAIAAGYVETDHCVEGMGYHYVHPDLIEDPAVDALAPEVLLYAPSGGGRVKLVGVEWVKFDDDRNPGTVETITVLGQRLHGPMTHGLPLHYDRHAWIWLGNPAGLFNDTNPKVTCDGR